MERPKYLEYRHRRDQVARYSVKRTIVRSLERPAAAILRLVGKKTSAKKDGFQEEWTMELRTTDVRPDYSALVKVQVTDAKKLIKGEEVAYDGADPTTEFLNETVDRFGCLNEHQGTLPSPHLIVFSEEPQLTGGEWEKSRQESLPVVNPDGRVAGHEAMEVSYRGRVDAYGESNGVEYADIAVSAYGRRGQETDPVWQEYIVSGNVRFALREGHMLTASVSRTVATHFEKDVLSITAKEDFEHSSAETELSVGGMRI